MSNVNTKKCKIGFFAAGYKGVQTIRRILYKYAEAFLFVCSYPVEGTLDDAYEEIKQLCDEKNIKFYDKADKQIKEYNDVDLIFCVGWQFLIQDIDNRIVVLHDSRLPQYKGFCPTVEALIQGDNVLGASAFVPTRKADEGLLIAQDITQVRYPLRINVAYDIVSDMYCDLIAKTIGMRNKGELELKEQTNHGASYCVWRDELDYYINWCESSERLTRFVHAVGWPYSGAKTLYKGEPIILKDVRIVDDLNIVNRTPGKIWLIEKNMPIVLCGRGLLQIIEATYMDGTPIRFTSIRQRFTIPPETIVSIGRCGKAKQDAL